MTPALKRERYYEVPKSAWLFTPAPLDGTPASLEEPVRQWCAHELIRAYGYRVIDLTFEHVVKVGSKNYRMDILIHRHGRPFAVVECKEPKFKQHDKALAQAISYAAARELRCEVVLYTNGATWLVQRQIGEHWSPVLDLPSAGEIPAGRRMDDLLFTLDFVKPVLAVLDEPLAGKEARALFGALQEFFLRPNLLTERFDRSLVSATDNLLRVLWAGHNDLPYRLGKFTTASLLISGFCVSRGCGEEIISDYRDVEPYMWFAELNGALYVRCDELSRDTTPDLRLLRFIQSLLTYGRELEMQRGKYPPIPPEVWHTLRAVLEFGFLCGLGIHLPDSLATKTESDMKSTCRGDWERYLKNDQAN